MSDELSFIHPTCMPIFNIIRDYPLLSHGWLTPGFQHYVAVSVSVPVTVSVTVSVKPCPYLPFRKHRCRMPLLERVARQAQ